MIQLKVLKGPQKLGKEFDITTGKSMLLGRATHCDLQLLSFGISKQHCKLTALPGGRLEVEDLGSANGTYVNGVQIQRHVVKPGDSISLSDFLFQIQWKPDLLPTNAAFTGIQQAPMSSQDSAQSLDNAQSFRSPKQDRKSKGGLQLVFASWIDPLAQIFPVHRLIFIGFLGWTLLTVLLGVFPFSKQANVRIQENSIQTAKLYARQLARINQKAIIEQRISDIVAVLDEKPGLTRGVIRSYILDAQRARILAPTNEAGNSLPNAFAVKATQQEQEWWVFDPTENLAYVSAPILVGTAEGKNATAATAFVVFDPSSDIFSFASILNNALTSLIILLAFTLVAAFIYQRFVLIPIQQLARNLERSVIAGAAFEKTTLQWDDLQEVEEKISILISRLPANSAQSNETPEDWNIRVASDISQPAAAFDTELKVLEWNDLMGQLSGVRREYAVGSDLGVASRDMAFEASVRELAERARSSPWISQNKNLDFQGRDYVLSMIYGSSNYLLLIRKEESS